MLTDEECVKIYHDSKKVYDELPPDEKKMPHGINLANKVAELAKQLHAQHQAAKRGTDVANKVAELAKQLRR